MPTKIFTEDGEFLPAIRDLFSDCEEAHTVRLLLLRLPEDVVLPEAEKLFVAGQYSRARDVYNNDFRHAYTNADVAEAVLLRLCIKHGRSPARVFETLARQSAL